MSKLYLSIFAGIFTLFLSIGSVFASGFVLQRIGGLDTAGHQYGEWWITATNPTLSGTTSPSTTVDVNVDGTTQTVTADASGNWTAATTAGEGDHTITLTSNGSTVTFTLHIGATMPENITAPAASDTPVAGNMTATIGLLSLGVLVLLLGFKFRPTS